jgi:hypothetical protein
MMASDTQRQNTIAQQAALVEFAERLRKQDKVIADLREHMIAINQDLQQFKQKEIAALVSKVGHGPTA